MVGQVTGGTQGLEVVECCYGTAFGNWDSMVGLELARTGAPGTPVAVSLEAGQA